MPDFPRNVPIILLANKQDLPDAHSRNDIQQLIISEFTSKILSHILPCCAITGEGLDDIFGVMHRYILEARFSSKFKIFYYFSIDHKKIFIIQFIQIEIIYL